MTAERNDPDFSPRANRLDAYRDVRRRHERRFSAERILEARRLRLIERVVQAARQHNLRAPRN